MIPFILQLSTTFILLFVFSSFGKCGLDCDHVAVKILRYDCDRVIVQILDTEITADPVSKDVQTGKEYNNVLSHYNTCKIAGIAKGENAALYVNIKQLCNSGLGDCVQCEAFSQHPPKTRVDFTTIEERPCGEKNVLFITSYKQVKSQFAKS